MAADKPADTDFEEGEFTDQELLDKTVFDNPDTDLYGSLCRTNKEMEHWFERCEEMKGWKETLDKIVKEFRDAITHHRTLAIQKQDRETIALAAEMQAKLNHAAARKRMKIDEESQKGEQSTRPSSVLAPHLTISDLLRKSSLSTSAPNLNREHQPNNDVLQIQEIVNSHMAQTRQTSEATNKAVSANTEQLKLQAELIQKLKESHDAINSKLALLDMYSTKVNQTAKADKERLERLIKDSLVYHRATNGETKQQIQDLESSMSSIHDQIKDTRLQLSEIQSRASSRCDSRQQASTPPEGEPRKNPNSERNSSGQSNTGHPMDTDEDNKELRDEADEITDK